MSRRAVAAARITAVVLVLTCSSGPVWARTGGAPAPGELRRITPELAALLDGASPDDRIPVMVTLRPSAGTRTLAPALDPSATTRAALLRSVVRGLRVSAADSRRPFLTALAPWRRSGLVDRVRPLWIAGGVALRATPPAIHELAGRSDVASVALDVADIVPATAPSGPVEANVELVGAPSLWQAGITGEGIVVAALDTGVDLGDPDIAAAWRGGQGGWFDPYGEHPAAPIDHDGHGTGVIGIMVGGDAGGTSIGTAPGATWIAARAFDDDGGATISGIHAAFQWLLDPDGDPATADAPHVVNGSWTFDTPGCDLTFQPDLQALRAAGILPVFASGNAPDAAYSPALNPEAFAVGAIDDADAIAWFSSRGPATCGPAATFPDLVAPGVDVRTVDSWGGWSDRSGTSFAAPHVAGALALLLDAHPGLTAADQEAALRAGAADLGSAGPDDTFGDGRLDVAASAAWLAAGGRAPAVMHLSVRGRTPGVPGLGTVAGADILRFDGDGFSYLFDGSDVGLAGEEVDAFAALGNGAILLSTARPVVLDGVGAVDDADVVRFTPTSLGADTSGEWAMELDGSDVGLSANGEDIDALEVLPGARFLLSTGGGMKVPGLAARDEDLLLFRSTSLGPATAGTWSLHLDGSDVGLASNSAEDLDAAARPAHGTLWLSTFGAVNVPGFAGGGGDVFVCALAAGGPRTRCVYDASPRLVAARWLPAEIDVDGVDAP